MIVTTSEKQGSDVKKAIENVAGRGVQTDEGKTLL